MINAPRQKHHVALFTECWRPLVNGVVASIGALRTGLHRHDVGVTIVTPKFPNALDDTNDIVHVPSLPLPTSTGYRLCVPFVNARDRERIRAASVVHVHSPFVTGWLGANIARRNAIPLVFTYHTRIDEYAHYAPVDARMTRAAMIALTRTFANRADAVIVPTHAMEERLREIGVRARIAVIASAIDAERFGSGRRSAAVRALLGARDDARIALVVSRLAKEKHIELALDAIARVGDMHLAIAGDGPQRATLEARAHAIGVRDRVHFTGALAPDALPDLYASADVFAFPSASETQGLVLAEAVAAGLPVVAVDTPVSREVLGTFGRFCPPDPAAFAAQLAAAAGRRRPDGAAEMGRRFGISAQAKKMLEVYAAI